MTLQPGYQTNTIHILHKISRSKGNQAMNFGQLIREKILFKNHPENEATRLVSDLFLYFKKALYGVKASGQQLGFNIFRQPLTWHTIKTNCIKLQTVDPEICSIFIFQKRFREQLLHHILSIIFQEKCLSCFILLTGQISLSDCLQLF